MTTGIRPRELLGGCIKILHIWTWCDTNLRFMMKNKKWSIQNLQVASDVINLKIIPVKMLVWIPTRATFETSNYPRRPWDRYTAPNSKCIGAEKLLILVIGLVEKIGRTVKQSSDLKTSSIPIPLQSLEAQLSSLSLVAVLLIRTVRLPCAFRFAPIFMVQSHFQYCCQSIKQIHILIET